MGLMRGMQVVHRGLVTGPGFTLLERKPTP